jgi:hypothetical protein
MEFDNSWRAVRNPGSAGEFFAPPPTEPLAAEGAFSLLNAWWLAEISRLVYVHDVTGGRRRDGFLARVGLRESRFLHRRGTQCAIVESRVDSVGAPAVVVFRGTDGAVDWRRNSNTLLTDWPHGGRAHAGFAGALDAVWAELETALEAVVGPLLYAGHSLGGALAVLAAGRRPPLAVYTFGAPRVGDADFAESLTGTAVYRVVNRRDAIARTPPSLPGLRFRQAGELRAISTRGLEEGEGTGMGGRVEASPPPLPGRRRWFDPPPGFCDHAPVNYVACLEKLARS